MINVNLDNVQAADEYKDVTAGGYVAKIMDVEVNQEKQYLRLMLDIGSEMDIYAQYDMSEEWVHTGHFRGTKLSSFSIPIRPKRCDHMRLRIEGVGDVKIYSITKTIEQGSELS